MRSMKRGHMLTSLILRENSNTKFTSKLPFFDCGNREKHMGTLQTCDYEQCLCLQVQTLFQELNCHTCILSHNEILNTHIVSVLIQAVKSYDVEIY